MKRENPYLVQLKKRYMSYLVSLIREEQFAPVWLRGIGTKPNTVAELHEWTGHFIQFEKKEDKPGWDISWVPWHPKKLGQQQWPEEIVIRSEEDFLHITDYRGEVSHFKAQLAVLLSWNPAIREWLALRPLKVLELAADWKNIMQVIDFILANDLSEYYIRTIPVPVHTKFIQQHEALLLSLLKYLDPDRFPAEQQGVVKALNVKSKPHLFPFRWLDDSLAERFTNGISMMAISSEDLKKLEPPVKEIWLVENETNLHLLRKRQHAIGVMSKGNALSLLFDIPFFNTARLLYWGDLDEAGFHMLHQFRQHYPNVESILMDMETVKVHREEIGADKPRKLSAVQLLPQEMEAFIYLRQLNGRIEQERLYQSYVQDYLRRKGLSSDEF